MVSGQSGINWQISRQGAADAISLDWPALRRQPASGQIIEDQPLATCVPEDVEIQGVLVGQMRAYR